MTGQDIFHYECPVLTPADLAEPSPMARFVKGKGNYRTKENTRRRENSRRRASVVGPAGGPTAAPPDASSNSVSSGVSQSMSKSGIAQEVHVAIEQRNRPGSAGPNVPMYSPPHEGRPDSLEAKEPSPRPKDLAGAPTRTPGPAGRSLSRTPSQAEVQFAIEMTREAEASDSAEPGRSSSSRRRGSSAGSHRQSRVERAKSANQRIGHGHDGRAPAGSSSTAEEGKLTIASA